MEIKKPTILIVDDVATNLNFLKGLLINDYDIKAANNGQLALKIARMGAGPDLILLDIMMSGMDGFQVCEELKRDPQTRDIPIIFLTARTATDDIVRGFKSGGVDYLTKPFNPPELLARVRTHLLIKQQKDIILEQNREQKELLHILCHDLANHFTVISMSLELLKNDSAITDYLSKIKTATTHGIDIINLVREMRALQEKKIEVCAVNLRECLKESVLLLGDRFEQKNVKLLIDIDHSLWVMAERCSLINSVINNLMTNALKFSFEGGQVEISATEEDDAVIFKIQDHGIGMPAELLSQIFDITKITSRPGTGGEIGTGFGMPLVKSFVEFYGGEIEVESRDINKYSDDHGTLITIKFIKARNN